MRSGEDAMNKPGATIAHAVLLGGLLFLPVDVSPAAPVGDGGDADPTTFSFFADNATRPLRNNQGNPIKREEVTAEYGQSFTILADGVDVCSLVYAWKLGFGGDHPHLLPKGMDLSKWEAVKVENGWVAIDPVTARFKFAAENKVDTPDRAKLVRRITLGNLTCWQIEVKDGFTFMPTEEETHGCLIMDATNPDRLRYAGHVLTPGYIMRLIVLKDHVYTFEGGHFTIGDIRNIRNHDIKYIKMTQLPSGGRVKCAWDPKRNLLFIRKGGRVLVYDVEDEDDPVLLHMLPLGGYGIAVDGGYGFLTGTYSIPDPENAGKTLKQTQLRTYKINRDGTWKELAVLKIEGRHGIWGSVDRGLHVRSGLAVTSTTAGLYLIDVSKPAKPRLSQKIEELKITSSGVYFGGAGGAKDYDIDRVSKRLFVTASGQVHVFDISSLNAIEKITVLKGGALFGGFGADFVRYENNYLYIGQRYNGLCLVDIHDLDKPVYKGSLSAFGEIEYAEPCGDFIYAVSSGLYVMSRYPAEKAELLGYVSTHTHMFGGNIVSSPYPRDNPDRIAYLDSSGHQRRVTAKDPRHPKMLEPHPPGGAARGQWVGKHLFAPGGGAGLIVYRIGAEGALEKIAQAPLGPKPAKDTPAKKGAKEPVKKGAKKAIAPAINRLVVRGNYAYGVPFSRGKGVLNEVFDIIYVFDISNPEEPKLVGKAKGPSDAGSMHSWTANLYGDFLYLGGWHAGRGWANFPGIRVYDVSDPTQPKPHALIHHIPKAISVDSIASPQTFYAVGSTLYVADYWSGLHVIDIADLKEKRAYKYIANLKDPDQPFSGNAYCLSVAGHGRYIYTTNFGAVYIWEIPVPSDVPTGKLTWRQGGGK